MKLSSYPQKLVSAEMQGLGLERDDLDADPRYYRMITRVLDGRLLIRDLCTAIVRLARMANTPDARKFADKVLAYRTGHREVTASVDDIPAELSRFDRDEVRLYMRRFGFEQIDLRHRPTVVLLGSKISGDHFIAETRRGVTVPRPRSQSKTPLTPDYFLTEKK